jgi:putative tricarboxylic transport membrane protein
MDIFHNLVLGFSVSLSITNLGYCFLGVVLGTLVGVLPGLGSPTAMALLLPLTFHSKDISGIIMLAGIWYGASYGGSTTSILLRIPGEGSSMITCLDGYEMAKQGRGGPALGISAFGSYIAGTLGLFGLMFFAPLLSEFALEFGPTEYFAITVLAMTLVNYMARGSSLKCFMMALVGIFLGTVGIDPVTSSARFTYNQESLLGGLDLVPIAIGLFGLSEILTQLDEEFIPTGIILPKGIKAYFPNREDWRRSIGPILRGTGLGFVIGIIPGGNAIIASFASYGMEKRLSDHPKKFGTGAIEGVAGPEAANNSVTAGAYIPLLGLGIPTNVMMALLLGAFMIHGIHPGPMLMVQRPDIFWGVITSMYIGNVMLLVLNLPLIPVFAKITKVPLSIMNPLICLICLFGAYTTSNNYIDILIAVGFGVFGYLARKFEFEEAPLLLGFILGPMMEVSFRQSLIISKGNFAFFFARPISATMLAAACLLFISPIIWKVIKKKKPLIDKDLN